MSSHTSPRIRRDPATAAAVMQAADSHHLVVRLLPSTGLEGAFRVHVLPENLDQAGLKLGDLCEISSEDGSTGYGIAWRADDRMGNRPKNRPIKMTETVRSTFGFQEGSRVTIQPTKTEIRHADKIVLSDVTPADYNKPGELDDGCWKTRTASLFIHCEALAPGIFFDVANKRKSRKQYYIERIESSGTPHDLPCLFRFDDATDLVIVSPGSDSTISQADGSSDPSCNQSTARETNDASPRYQLDMDRIGGLLEQCQTLNVRLRRYLHTTEDRKGSVGPSLKRAVLLHGYEGTGKTLLLKQLARTCFRKVIWLERSTLTGGSIAKNQSIIRDFFQDAVTNQPSLILMDNLEELVPTDDIAYASTIVAEMDKVKAARVMLVGATRSPINVKSTLISPGAFVKQIELPIPDLAAREQILNVLRGKPVYSPESISTTVAARTHGFTGKDLALLYELADDAAETRIEQEREESAGVRPSSPPPPYSLLTDVARPVHPAPNSGTEFEITLSDFSDALSAVRPTALREIFTVRPKIRWDDIGGSQAVQKTFDRIIGWPLQHKDASSRIRWTPPKGILLYGPPGCSKTLTAQAVANMYNFNFIAIKGAELVSMYVGESERAIRDIFRKARAAAPCVIFFDEIDSIGGDRDGASGGAATKGLNVLTTLLNEMDGFEVLKDVFILAATNRPETLDPALMRPGRFDLHVYLGPPNDDARREILNIAMREIPVAADIDFDALVRKTDGFSGAEIVRVCEAAKEPAIERYISDTSKEIELAASDLQLALESAKKKITPEMLAAYEAFAQTTVD